MPHQIKYEDIYKSGYLAIRQVIGKKGTCQDCGKSATAYIANARKDLTKEIEVKLNRKPCVRKFESRVTAPSGLTEWVRPKTSEGFFWHKNIKKRGDS